MPHADEFGFWASLIFAALLLLMSALFTWLAWITRQKSLQSYQKLYSHYPELEKEFYKIYNQSRYSREKLSLYLYKDCSNIVRCVNRLIIIGKEEIRISIL